MRFQLLTLNIWGAPYGKHREARMKLIGERIVAMQPDVVVLQEVYLESNRDALLAILTDGGYGHFHYYASGLLGSGLLTVSKHPIVDVAFSRYRMGGKPLMVKHGDYYAGKGIGLARVAIGDAVVDVYNIHPHAQYELDDDNAYAVYTDSNLYEAGRFIEAHSSDNAVILAGDFNVRPNQSGYRLIRAMTGLRDSYMAIHNEAPITFAPQNAYVASSAQCLDYIMVRDGRGVCIKVMNAEITMTDSFDVEDDGAEQFSDHYGVVTDFEIEVAEGAWQLDHEAREASMKHLHKRLSDALSDTLIERGQYHERALLSGASIVDLWLAGKFIGRFVPKFGHWLKTWGIIVSLSMAIYFTLQGRINLEAKKQTLESLRDEVGVQLGK